MNVDAAFHQSHSGINKAEKKEERECSVESGWGREPVAIDDTRGLNTPLPVAVRKTDQLGQSRPHKHTHTHMHTSGLRGFQVDGQVTRALLAKEMKCLYVNEEEFIF